MQRLDLSIYFDNEITAQIVQDEITNQSINIDEDFKILLPYSGCKIGEDAFNGFGNLSEIINASKITEIGQNAFCSTKLNGTLYLSNCQTFGNYCFDSCKNLTKIILKSDGCNLGDGCFEYCENLTSVSNLKNVTSIGSYCFCGCNLKGEIWLSKIKTIPEYCFSDNKLLTSIKLTKDGNNFIAKESCFYGCTSLKNIDITKFSHIYANSFVDTNLSGTLDLRNCTYMEDYSFLSNGQTTITVSPFNKIYLNPNNIENITLNTNFLADGIKEIYGINTSRTEWMDFVHTCNSLEKISFDKYIDIPQDQFKNFTNLKEVTFKNVPDIIINIGAFQNCTSLNKIDGLQYCTVIYKDAFNGCTSIGPTINLQMCETISNNSFRGCTSIQKVTLKNSAVLGDNCFAGCTQLQTVVNLKDCYLGKCTFSGCNLTGEIYLNQTEIPADCFNMNIHLTKVRLNGATLVSNSAFQDCTQLRTVEGLENVENIGYNAFSNCNLVMDKLDLRKCKSLGLMAFDTTCKFTKIYFNSQYSINYEQITPDKDYIKEVYGINTDNLYMRLLTFQSQSLTDVSISKDTTIVGGFQDCYNLKNVNILSNSFKIDESAFQGCNSLQNINNLDKCSQIGKQAFSESNISKNINLSNCSLIGQDAFQGCINLQNVKLKDNCSIGTGAFRGCFNLNGISNLSNVSSIGDLAFENVGYSTNSQYININCNTIGNSAFSGCNVKNVKCNCFGIPNYCFRQCSKLEEATLDCSEIGEHSFDMDTSVTETVLRKVKLGSDIYSIRKYAFNKCTALASINLNKVREIDEGAFFNCTSLPETIDIRSCDVVQTKAFSSTNTKTVFVKADCQYVSDSFPEGCQIIVK